MDNNYWLMRMNYDKNEGKSAKRYDIFYEKTGCLSAGWNKLSYLSDPDAILEGHGPLYDHELGSGNKQALSNLLQIREGDIILVPWTDWTQFCLFKATSPWMTYYELMKHSEKAQELAKEWDFFNDDYGFFVQVEELSDIIKTPDTPFKAASGSESPLGSIAYSSTVNNFNKYKDEVDQVIASLPPLS